MLKLIKYYPVNWIDGMKLNREHFIQQEMAFTDAVRDVANQQLNGWNYGLLPGLQGPDSSLSYHIDVDRAGLLRVRLDTCRAVTPAGARVEVVNIPGQQLHTSLGELNAEFNFMNHNGKKLFVVISVNPFERDYFGEPDASEHPPRYPLTKPAYRLDVIPEDQFLEIGPFHLPVAMLQVQSNAAQIVEQYVPPCTTMSSHHVLAKLADELDQFYSQMEIHTSTILQKIHQKTQKKDLAEMAQYICDRLLAYLASVMHGYRWTGRDLPPVAVIAQVAGLARVIKGSLEVRSGTGREEFINYLTDWDEFNLQQGEFEAVLNDLVLMEYDHLDLNDSLVRVRKFHTTLNQVFTKLAKLDYIGKREDPGIIVAQRTAQEAAKKSGSKGSSIWLE